MYTYTCNSCSYARGQRGLCPNCYQPLRMAAAIPQRIKGHYVKIR